MTIEEAIKNQLGHMALQLIALNTELENAKAKIAELEAKLEKENGG